MKNSLDKYIRGSPHYFDLTIHTIFDLINIDKNQVLVINKKSIVEKTECVKLIAFYFNKKNNEENNENSTVSLEDKILTSNPVLESLENILKFLLILKINLLLVLTYLLEKSIFVNIVYGQRNYHIFLSNCLNF